MAGEGYEQETEGGGAFSVERAFTAVRRRLHIVAMVTGLAVGLTGAAMWLLPNRYDASSLVQIDPRKKTISNMESVLSELKADAATVESEVEIIRSRGILLKVIEILGLRKDPEFAKPAGFQPFIENLQLGRNLLSRPVAPEKSELLRIDKDPIARLVGTTEPGKFEPERDEVAVAFAERLKVTRVRTTLLIEIRFSSGDPVKAAKIANTIAEVYLADQLDGKKKASGFATGMLERKLEEMRGEVADSERKVAHFKADNNIFDSEGQLLSEKQLARLMEQTVVARNSTAEAQAKYQQAQAMLKNGETNDAIKDVLESHTIRLMKEELGKATKRAAELETRYGPRHPEMQKVRAEVADASRQLRAEIDRLASNLKNEFEVAHRREADLTRNMTSLKEQEATSKEASVKLLELQRESSTSKQLYEALLTRYKQTAETEELQLPDARIIEQADVPLFPAAPKRQQMTIIALFAGLVGGLGIVLIMEFAVSGISRPEDAERAFDIAHIASVPDIGDTAAEDQNSMRAIRLLLAEPRSVFSETIRGIRREIDLRRSSAAPRIILVASSLPGEGSDVIASNLANHYALTGNRVLLIDGDLRRAPLTRRLAPARSIGLLDVLSGGYPVESAILHDGSTGLSFLPAMSPTPLQPASPELLAAPQMDAVLRHLKRQFDTIIIEAPPLLPVIDTRILADYADQILFVVAWRKTPKQLAKKALHSLGINHDKIAGVVINRVDQVALEDTHALGARMATAEVSHVRRAA